jgi:hypothetical protein
MNRNGIDLIFISSDVLLHCTIKLVLELRFLSEIDYGMSEPPSIIEAPPILETLPY